MTARPADRDDYAGRPARGAWNTRRLAKARRLAAVAGMADGKALDPHRLREALHALIRPGDRVALEGDNQKHADFLSRTLSACDPAVLHDLHLLVATISRPEHLDLFERGIAKRLDMAYAGGQSVRIAEVIEEACKRQTEKAVHVA